MDALLASLGSAAIAGDSPAGFDARYEPEYAVVLEEIEKLSFSVQGATTSWSTIEKNAVLILSEKSKDFQIAAYLGVALWQNHGMEGFAAGLHILIDLLTNFWEEGWPARKRIRARVNAINWWHERSYSYVQNYQADPISTQQQQDYLDALAALDALIDTHMPDASPLHDLMAVVKRLPIQEDAPQSAQNEASQDEVPQNEAEPSAVLPGEEKVAAQANAQLMQTKTEALAPNTPSATHMNTAHAAEMPDVSNIPDTDDPVILYRHFSKAGIVYIASARKVDASQADLWQLLRCIIWGNIKKLPPNVEGQTMIPAPDTHSLTNIRHTMLAGDAVAAALAAEEFFITAPLCLDVQELIYTALTKAGPQFTAAAIQVRAACEQLINRLPGVETLRFADDTPFANETTLAWLCKASVQAKKITFEPVTLQSSDDIFTKAYALAQKDGLNAALAFLDSAKSTCETTNTRLRLYQLQLLHDGGKEAAACALAKALLQRITAHSLEIWQPDLALDLLIVIRAVLCNDVTSAQDILQIEQRIALLRPAALL